MQMKTWMRSLLTWGCAGVLYGQPVSLEWVQNFYDTQVTEQAALVQAAFNTTPTTPSLIPIPGILGYAPLIIQNNTGLSSDRLYVIGKGLSLAATNAYFLQPNLTTGICSLVLPNGVNSADPTISVQLSKLPSAGTNAFYVYVPQLISGRFYISVDAPLYMQTTYSGIYGINDPSQTATQDPNYYTLYQDFEFTLNDVYDLYANVTNVDYFCLPMTLGSYTYPTGNLYPTLDNLTVVGYPETSARSTILQAIQSGLTSQDASSPPQWTNLVIPFYANPYVVSSPATDLRILAAKLSISLQNGYLFQGAANSQGFFNSLYLQSTTSGPAASISYMQKLYDFLQTESIQIEIFPKDLPAVTYTMSAAGTNLLLNLIPVSGTSYTLNLDTLTTEALLSGAVGEWSASFSPSSTGPVTTELAKMISALFSAGMLPPANTVVQPIVDSDSYFSAYRGTYFSNPTGFSLHGPWYNLYDKVIHPLLIQTGGFGLGYAYDFDDLLAIAGLLHVNIQTGGQLNPDQPYSVLTVGPIDTTIPDPTENFGPYQLSIGALGHLSNPIDVIYSAESTGSPNQTYSVISSPGVVSSAYNYFYVRFYTDGTKTNYLTYAVYPKYQLVLPTGTRYNSQDVALMNGIVFITGTNGTNFSISLPNTSTFPN
ncbi:MAG: beta-1,3-glucanase family protein [Chlamydiales bacterium]|nr:beta-1,3-glucanase family protein [Chlamydiales bacterium]